MYRIFLVEDDETIAKLVRRHLEKWDYDVHVVQKFDAVMSEFASFDPHLVLMDTSTPRTVPLVPMGGAWTSSICTSSTRQPTG